MFLKKHIKTIHSNERALRERVTNVNTEESEYLLQDHTRCNVGSVKDKENANRDMRNDTSQNQIF